MKNGEIVGEAEIQIRPLGQKTANFTENNGKNGKNTRKTQEKQWKSPSKS